MVDGGRTRSCVRSAARSIRSRLDLRYVGQEFTLSVPVTIAQVRERRTARASAPRSTRSTSSATRMHSPEEPVELVNVRLAAIGQRPRLHFPRLEAGAAPKPETQRPVYLGGKDAGRIARSIAARRLPPGARIDGPAIIQEHGTTTVLFAGDRCTVAPSGELIIEVGGA